MRAASARVRSESGFTLVELMVSSMITLIVMSVAFSTFDHALKLNDTVLQVADASQNLRAATNILVKDLMMAGRNIPIGGIAIPSGEGADPILRPGPPGASLTFDNTTATTLTAITTGHELGPTIAGRKTDLVTIVMADPFLEPLENVMPWAAGGGGPRLAADGSSLHPGSAAAWIAGDPNEGVAPIAQGDLIYFQGGTGTALQTVTEVDDEGVVHFEEDDQFNLNQREVEAGSITQILGVPMTVRRVHMFTYYVRSDDGTPRMVRALNHFEAQPLAGVIELMELSFDLTDGEFNPTNVRELPHTANGVTYSANQIRKANVQVGVRSEHINIRSRDYLRHYLSTVISVRNLVYVDRYAQEDEE